MGLADRRFTVLMVDACRRATVQSVCRIRDEIDTLR